MFASVSMSGSGSHSLLNRIKLQCRCETQFEEYSGAKLSAFSTEPPGVISPYLTSAP